MAKDWITIGKPSQDDWFEERPTPSWKGMTLEPVYGRDTGVATSRHMAATKDMIDYSCYESLQEIIERLVREKMKRENDAIMASCKVVEKPRLLILSSWKSQRGIPYKA